MKYHTGSSGWHDYNGNERINGNTNSNYPRVWNLIPFDAKHVRIYPQAWYSHMSLRWEVFAVETDVTVAIDPLNAGGDTLTSSNQGAMCNTDCDRNTDCRPGLYCL